MRPHEGLTSVAPRQVQRGQEGKAPALALDTPTTWAAVLAATRVVPASPPGPKTERLGEKTC